jgi:hypothetical protein
MHAGRQEMFYPDTIPPTPSEPSVSSGFQAALAATQHLKTLDVLLRGLSADTIDLEEAVAGAQPVVEDPARFADEFVKLEGKLQTAIMGNEQLLKYFRTHPSMLKDLTADKVSRIVGDFMQQRQSAPPQQPPQHQQQAVASQDKTGWGVASIVSSIKNQVRSNIQQQRAPPPNPHPYQQQPYRRHPPPAPPGHR